MLTERLREAERAAAELPGSAAVVGSVLFAAVIDAVLAIADADDPAAARAQIEPTLYLFSVRALGIAPTSTGAVHTTAGDGAADFRH